MSNVMSRAKVNPESFNKNIILNFSVIIGKNDIKQLELLAKYKEDIEIIEKENATIVLPNRHEDIELVKGNNELDKKPISSQLEKIGGSVELNWKQFKIYIQGNKDMPIFVGVKPS